MTNTVVFGCLFVFTLTLTLISSILLIENPEELSRVWPGLLWAVIFTAAFGYGFFSSVTRRIWSASLYSENRVDDLVQAIESELSRRGLEYDLRMIGRMYTFEVRSPLKAKITVREWTHTRAGIPVPSGTVIEVRPHPSKAPEEFKEALRYALISTGLIELAGDWY